MTNKMREEFEAWYEGITGLPVEFNDVGIPVSIGSALSETVTMGMWVAWRASRESLCVNACSGMEDPAAEIAELKRQRDELLGLVKAASYHSIPATVDGIKCAAFPWAEYESMVIKAKGSTS